MASFLKEEEGESIGTVKRWEEKSKYPPPRNVIPQQPLVTGLSYISGWLRKSRLKHVQPIGFEDSMDTHIRALQQCEVVECMCQDIIHFNSPGWPKMITMHLFTPLYLSGNQTSSRCLVAPPGVLR